MNQPKLNTVRLMKNGALRIGQGLLGKMAGNRKLRFQILFLDDRGSTLVVVPSIKPPGWPAVYYADGAKSPCVSLEPFMRMYSLPDNYFPQGEFEVEKDARGRLIIDFNKKSNGVTFPKRNGRKKK